MLFLTLAIVTLFLFAEGHADGFPQWKSLLIHHKDWIGIYQEDLNSFDCSVFVHSVQMDSAGAAWLTFSSKGISIEMSAYSTDDKIVTFEESTTWNKTLHFEGHEHLNFIGKFESYGGYFRYIGNVSSHNETNFAIVSFTPKGSQVRRAKATDDSYKYGLAIGIPVVLAVILMVAAAMIIWWAVRKGYLRHIPWAYKNFRNPSRMDQEMSDTQVDQPGQETDQPTIHISRTQEDGQVQETDQSTVHM